jgi:tripartite ATP-independent transporter DctM subunit
MMGALGLLWLAILILAGLHIGLAMSVVGLLGIFILSGLDVTVQLLGWQPYHSLALFPFLTLPLFMMMGEFAHYTGAASSAFSASYKWLGNLRGGLAMAVVAASALFAACSGSSIAGAATMSRVCYPELKRYGYDKGFSAGLVASSGSLAALIPPSVIMVLYAMFTNVSLARLLIAGFIPGIISAIVWMTMIHIRIRVNPAIGPGREAFPWKERFRSLGGLGGIFIIVLFVIGGMYIGIFTASEAAAGGAILTLVLALFKRTLTFRIARTSINMTCVTTCSLFFIVFGALLFSKFLSLSGVPRWVVDLISSLSVPPIIILVAIMVMYVFLGCLLEAAAMLAVTLPVVFPLIVSIGYDPIWFGVICVKLVEMAVITPPVGLNVYAAKSVLGEEVPIESIFKNIFFFLWGDVIIIVLLIVFPQIALFLPSQVIGK